MSRRPSVANVPPPRPTFNRPSTAQSQQGDHPSRPERRRPVDSPTPSVASSRFDHHDTHDNQPTPVGVAFASPFNQGAGLAPGMAREGSTSSSMTEDGSSPHAEQNGAGSKSRRMMDQLQRGGARPSSPLVGGAHQQQQQRPPPTTNSPSLHPASAKFQHSRRDSGSSQGSAPNSSRATSPAPGESPDPGATVPSMALQDAISAFAGAGARRDGRRGGLADQGFDAKPKVKSAALNPHEYPDTPAFREVEGVLRKVQQEWPVLMYGTEPAPGDSGEQEDREFDPVSLALGLLDPNSVSSGQSLQAFLRLKAELDHAISSTLASSSNSYRAYESSITTHNSTLGSLTASQRQVENLKKTLTDAREKLEGKGREGLAAMWSRMGHLEEMGKILDEIDHFRSIPDRLESLLSEKRFLSAVVLLVRSLKAINKPEMLEIGALSDLRSWLAMQEGVLLEILIEELHNHLYLKSFYCDARWKPYARGQQALPVVDFGDDAEQPAGPAHLEATFHASGRSRAKLPQQSKLQRYLNYLSVRPSINPLFDEPIDEYVEAQVDDIALGYEGGSFALPALGTEPEAVKRPAAKNPEIDSFAYIEGLMESLACLGKLGYGLDAISQRVQGEMFNLVDTTVEEVDERNDSTKQTLSATARPASSYLGGNLPRQSLASLSSLSLSHASTNRSSLLRLTTTESNELEMNVETLRDLFWTLYSKLDAVLQGFRVAYEVATRIAERRDFKDGSIVKSQSGNLLFSLLDVWKPVQTEVRALLHDYLTDDQSGTVSSRNPIVSVNEVLRLAKPRDATKQIFKFADSDLKASTKLLKAHEDSLNKALKTAVPGLITDSSAASAPVLNSMMTTDDRYGGARAGLGGTHKALISADAFNVSVLFAPTLAFLDRVKEVMPGGLLGDDDVSGFGGFLDDFVLRTFLPQLEEKVSTVFHQAVGGLDAFQEDSNYKKVSRVPIVKSVTNLMLLISSLCAMLRATPFHRENYSHLIVSVIHQFYQRCHERFKDLAARDPTDGAPQNPNSASSPLKTSATWAEAGEINACLAELRAVPEKDKDALREVLRRETKLELDKKRNGQVAAEDLIHPPKKLLALCTLYSSLDWFIVHVSSLKTSADGPSANGGAFRGEDGDGYGGGEEDAEDSDEDAAVRQGGFALPLTSEMARPFEALLKSYRQLANLVLFTIRLEIRLRTIHFLDKATRDGVYQLAEDIQEPDPSVVDLNSELAECDECAAGTLAPAERKFIFEGLSLLMDQLLITNSRHIRLANAHGLSKMSRNLLALQQNLKNIGDSPLEVDFDRSRKFWDVFGKGPKEMLELIRTGQIHYEFEDYKALLNLMCGVDQSSKDAGGARGPESGVPLSGGGGERSRRMYNEYLIDLFALDVEGAD